MASIWKHPKSRYYTGCYTDNTGRQRKKSTKETDPKEALKHAERWERAYRQKMTEAQVRKVISEIHEEVSGQPLAQSSVRKFLLDWLASKKQEIASGSTKRYENAIEKLIAYLGDRAEDDIAYVTKPDIRGLRDKTAEDLSRSTANTDLKILRIAFAQAVRDNFRFDNPAAAIPILKIQKQPGDPERRPFTETEINRVLAVSTGEWGGMIYIAAYTGARLGDIAGVTWDRIDLVNRHISVRAGKTGNLVIVPLAPTLESWLKKWHKKGARGVVFPKAAKLRKDADGESRRLSAQFRALMVKAGLVEKRSKKNTGRGHSVKRTVSELTFHSLRHSATSWLKNAGVPEAVVRDIIGHESPIVSLFYTHMDHASKQRAIKTMPKLGKPMA